MRGLNKLTTGVTELTTGVTELTTGVTELTTGVIASKAKQSQRLLRHAFGAPRNDGIVHGDAPRNDVVFSVLWPVLFGLCLLLFLGPTTAAAVEGRDGELIVKFREGGAQTQVKALAAAGARAVKSMRSDSRFKLVRADSPAKLAALKDQLEVDTDIEYVEANQTAKVLFMPNDPYFVNGAQWNLEQIKAPAAWGIAPGAGNGVIVAVLDTGVAYEDNGIYHRVPDLAPATFVPGRDFVNNDNNPNDDHGHGTHIAGVIAQTTNNGYGAAGLAYGAKIMPVKVLDKYGLGNTFAIADAIRWAADNGAKVINLSLGVNSPSPTIKEAVNYARNNKEVTVVAAAGNSADPDEYPDYKGGLMYPAVYPSVISVGATRYTKLRASYSQYGSALDLVAPGGEMGLGLDRNGDGYPDGIVQETIQQADWGAPADPSKHGFYWAEGTSVAAPHVAAAAAMVIARGITEPDGVYQALTKSAQDLGDKGYDTKYGYGLLNVAAALQYRPAATAWYFAEGNTANNFNTKILIGNSSDRTAKLRVTFTKPSGARTIKRYSVRGDSRYTIDVDNVSGLGSTGVSAKVESINGVGIVAERAMYFNYHGKTGGHVTLGAPAPARTWYLAEGDTKNSFETQVFVYNPSDNAALFRATFTKPRGARVSRDYTIPAWGREKIVVDKLAGLGSAQFAAKVESLNGIGIVVERSMYFNYRGRGGGHNTIGATAPSRKWLFAEGATGAAFDSKILVQNPSSGQASIRVDFYKAGGGKVTRRYTIGAGRRLTIPVDRLPGMEATEFSAKITSTNGVGIVAERSMYFDFGGRNDGHVTIGAVRPYKHWYLADGYTGDGFDTWILIFNPRSREAKLTVDFLKPDGSVVTENLTVPALSRRSISVDGVAGLADTEVATVVTSNNGVPVVVERSAYFNYNGWDGGDASIGYGN